MPGLDMAVPVGPVMVVADGVVPPVRMAAFPAMKTLQPEGVAEEPEIAGPEIVTLIPHEPDIFVTIPDVIVRNHDRGGIDDRGRGRIDHGLRRHHHEGPYPCHPSIRLNDTAGQ
jgi:hypothetical protein